MKNRKSQKENRKSDEALTFYGQVNRTETVAFVCDVFLLAMFLMDQFIYGLNMGVLILPLTLIGLYLLFFGALPERYVFTKETLEIWNIACKTASIPYQNVFNLDITRKDGFVNVIRQNKVKVYYTTGKKKKLIICNPRVVDDFSDELKKRCPEFEVDWKNSNLKVFFENKK